MTTTDVIVCTECGGRNNPGDSFCGYCGAYLAWDEKSTQGQPDARSASDPPTAADAPARDAATDAAPPPETHVTPSRKSARAEAASTPVAAVAPAPVPPPLPPLSAADAAAAPAASDGPALRRPSGPERPIRQPPPQVPVSEPRPGDILCPQCGTPNQPDRRFCRNCAAPLAHSAPARTSSQPKAGARPKGRNGRFPLTAVVVLAVILGLIVVGWFERDIVVGFVRDVVGFVFSPSSHG